MTRAVTRALTRALTRAVTRAVARVARMVALLKDQERKRTVTFKDGIEGGARGQRVVSGIHVVVGMNHRDN